MNYRQYKKKHKNKHTIDWAPDRKIWLYRPPEKVAVFFGRKIKLGKYVLFKNESEHSPDIYWFWRNKHDKKGI